MRDSKLAVSFSLFGTPLGDCGIAWCGDTVVATQLPERNSSATAARLKALSAGCRGVPSPAIQQAIESITSLLEGEKTDLTHIVCDFGGVDPFATKVYAVTRAIPAGETLTYGDIAVELGDKLLAQSVGRTLGRNPFPIVVPCHRVLGANDKLTGFSAYGGVETKLRMLAIEGVYPGGTPGLFDDLPLH